MPFFWKGTAASAVDLHPAGYDFSEAGGMSGSSQVGQATGNRTNGYPHAILWNGTAESAVDLNPEGYISSLAHGVSGTTQVGSGYGPASGSYLRALLWNGTPESVVDLHPFLNVLRPTMYGPEALGISQNGVIVGSAYDGTGTNYAVMWIPCLNPRRGFSDLPASCACIGDTERQIQHATN